MKVNKEIKLNNGKIEIVTKQEHEFSEMEKKILNISNIKWYNDINFEQNDYFNNKY